MHDPHNLQRFVIAQAPVFETVLAELRAARKRTHWMWFVFPQLAGLGASFRAEHYAIRSLGEARAYFAHHLLGPRLMECVGLMNRIEGGSATEVLGSPDDMKFRSCLTLFEQAETGNALFREALAKYYGGEEDPVTLRLLGIDAS